MALLVTPATAAAQHNQFVDAVRPFYFALAGVYGDEGPLVAARLDALAVALTRWDRALAVTELTRRARLDDRDVQTKLEAHTELASVYAERGQVGNSIREASEAIRLDPGRTALHRFQASLYQAARQPSDAADSFRAAWLVAPDDPLNASLLVVHRSNRTTRLEVEQALRTLSSTEQRLVQGQRRAAQSPFIELNALTALGGDMAFAPAAYASGFALVLNGDFDAGIAALRRAAATDPLVADPVSRSEPMASGIAALRQGSVTQAIVLLETALATAPGSSEAHRIIATAYATSGDIERSGGHLKEAIRLNPLNERAWVGLVRALDGSGKLEDVVEVLEQAVGRLPDSGALRWLLSRTARLRQITSDRDLEMIAMADRLVLLAGTDDLYGRVAALAQQHLDDDRAVELLEKRVALTPNRAAAHKDLGLAYVDRGRNDEGYAELVVALMLDPADADTLSALGRLHVSEGRYAEAVAALTRAVAIQPSHMQAVHALGIALTATGRTKEGQLRLSESERLQRGAVDQQRRRRTTGMLALQAEIRMREGDHEGAIPLWQHVIELDDGRAPDHLRLAEALAAVGRIEDAAAQIRTAISGGAAPEAHRRLAEIYAALGRYDESARERRTYVELRLQELRAAAGETAKPVQ